MKSITFLLSALMGIMFFQAAAMGDASTLGGPLAGFGIVDLEWIVPVSAQHNDTIVGTIQDVANHLAAVDSVAFAEVNKTINEALDASHLHVPGVPYQSRDDSPGMYDPVGYKCDAYSSGVVSGGTIRYGIEYLRQVGGTPTQGPGPQSCGRVSCSYDAAIYWCNNITDQGLVLDTYGRIADGAQSLMTDCCFIHDDGTYGFFNGIQLYGGNWYVAVLPDAC